MWSCYCECEKSQTLFSPVMIFKNNFHKNGNSSYSFRTINKSEIIDCMMLIFNSFYIFYNFYFIHYIYPYLLSLHIYYIYYTIILFYLLYFYH